MAQQIVHNVVVLFCNSFVLEIMNLPEGKKVVWGEGVVGGSHTSPRPIDQEI